jgi:hypothetical protein
MLANAASPVETLDKIPSVKITERRRFVRASVVWPVVVFSGRGCVRSDTVNISQGGFYCPVPGGVTVGDMLVCSLTIPGGRGMNLGARAFLKCLATVVRVDKIEAAGRRGAAFEINEYSIGAGAGGCIQFL